MQWWIHIKLINSIIKKKNIIKIIMFIELLGKLLYYKNDYIYRDTWQVIIDR